MAAPILLKSLCLLLFAKKLVVEEMQKLILEIGIAMLLVIA
jgi:hypothetical protein